MLLSNRTTKRSLGPRSDPQNVHTYSMERSSPRGPTEVPVPDVGQRDVTPAGQLSPADTLMGGQRGFLCAIWGFGMS